MSHALDATRKAVIEAAIAIVYDGNSDAAWHRIRRAVEAMENAERQERRMSPAAEAQLRSFGNGWKE